MDKGRTGFRTKSFWGEGADALDRDWTGGGRGADGGRTESGRGRTGGGRADGVRTGLDGQALDRVWTGPDGGRTVLDGSRQLKRKQERLDVAGEGWSLEIAKKVPCFWTHPDGRLFPPFGRGNPPFRTGSGYPKICQKQKKYLT